MNSLSKKIFAGLAIGLLVLPLAFAVLPGHTAHADPTTTTVTPPNNNNGDRINDYSNGGDSLLGGLQNFLLDSINGIRNFIGNMLIGVTGMITWMIAYGTTVINFPVVKAGFQVTLSFVNLLFVMALIVIAFEIILDYHAGEAKKTLAHLILAALLVNFSLLIAGFLLDFSNVFTNYFMSSITADRLGAALSPQKFVGIFSLGTSPTFVVELAASLFSLTMTAIILIVMIAVLVMTTVRNIWVAGLLLVMPLTWGFWVFPGMREHLQDWWHSFIKYGVTYLPTVTFFIWLALASSAAIGLDTASIHNASGNTQIALQSTSFGKILSGLLDPILQLILVIGIVIFGLKAAEKAGDGAHSIAMGFAKRTGGTIKGVAGYGYRANVRAGKYSIGAQSGVDATRRGMASLLNTQPLRWIPGAKGAANALSGAAKNEELIAERQKEFASKLSNEQLDAIMKKGVPFNTLTATAYLREAVKRGRVDQIEHDNLRGWMNAAKAANQGTASKDIAEIKGLVSHDPLLARETIDEKNPSQEKIDEFIGKAIRKATPKDAGTWEKTVFDGLTDTQFMNITNAQFAEIGKGKKVVREAAHAKMKRISETTYTAGSDEANVAKRFKDFLEKNPGLQISGTGSYVPPAAGGDGH